VSLTIMPLAGADPREAIFGVVTAQGWALRELSHAQTSLEEIFVQITREEDEAEEERREAQRSLLR
jgi:hypothetical protein